MTAKLFEFEGVIYNLDDLVVKTAETIYWAYTEPALRRTFWNEVKHNMRVLKAANHPYPDPNTVGRTIDVNRPGAVWQIYYQLKEW